jgi:hypothetical protein
MRKIIFVFLLILSIGFSCTSAIISGKITKTGRPIIWKHRDSDSERNIVIYEKSTKYKFIAIANAEDKDGSQIWMGANEKGLVIINTASYNLQNCNACNGKEDEEGLLMRYVLANCQSVPEFEKIIEKKGQYGVYANFGLIDAQGNAAYYEYNGEKYVKYDVNDPNVAPKGYLIRTNFSFSGDTINGKGYFRYYSTEKLFDKEIKINKKLSDEFILFQADRNLVHGLTNIDLSNYLVPNDTNEIKYFPFRDYVPRYSTVSTFLVNGVKKGEDTENMIIWVNIGNSLVTPSIPLKLNYEIPSYLTYNDKYNTSEINYLSLLLKKKLFPINYDNGSDYINLSFLINKQWNGTIQKVKEAEKKIYKLFYDNMNEDLYKNVYLIVKDFYMNYFKF